MGRKNSGSKCAELHEDAHVNEAKVEHPRKAVRIQTEAHTMVWEAIALPLSLLCPPWHGCGDWHAPPL